MHFPHHPHYWPTYDGNRSHDHILAALIANGQRRAVKSRSCRRYERVGLGGIGIVWPWLGLVPAESISVRITCADLTNANLVSQGTPLEGYSIVGIEVVNQGESGYGVLRSVPEGDRWKPDCLDYVGPKPDFVPFDMAMTK